MRCVASKANAAAHRDPVGERDDRMPILRDPGIEGVLGAEEGFDLFGVIAH